MSITQPTSSRSAEALELGQFIPSHYHHPMLTDRARMGAFQAAIAQVVVPGAKVVELGGGTGVQSFFAAQRGAHVTCVECNPELLRIARSALANSPHEGSIELVAADATQYVPSEPVDVVICEMLHAGLLREKQLEVIAAFKRNYRARFGPRLPLFVPEAVVLGVQAVEQDFVFSGYHCPIPIFQDPALPHASMRELTAPEVYGVTSFDTDFPLDIRWEGGLLVLPAASAPDAPCHINALRLITKSIVAIVESESRTIDWHLSHLVLPLPQPISARPGDLLRVSFAYAAGAPLDAFTRDLRIEVLPRVETLTGWSGVRTSV